MAPHSNTPAWKIPWMKEPGRLQSMGSLRVGHDWATSLSLFTIMHWRRKWQPTPVFCLENPRDGEAWRAAVYGITESRTRLKWLSSSSLSFIFITLEGWSKKILLQFMSERILPVFSSKSYILSGFTYMSIIHFEFIFVYDVRGYCNFILLHVAVQFSQHHLLKRLSFLHCVYSFFLCHRWP